MENHGKRVGHWQKGMRPGVSKNDGIPKSSILIGFSIINHPFWGTPIFGNTQMRLLYGLYWDTIPFLPPLRSIGLNPLVDESPAFVQPDTSADLPLNDVVK